MRIGVFGATGRVGKGVLKVLEREISGDGFLQKSGKSP